LEFRVKSFALGLGVGMAAAALAGFAAYAVDSGRIRHQAAVHALTDEQVIARADKLGMIFADKLPQSAAADRQKQADAGRERPLSGAGGAAAAYAGQNNPFAASGSAFASLAQPAPAAGRADDGRAAAPGTVIEVQIRRGAAASAIADELEKAWVIGDGADFNRYLINRLITYKLNYGTFSFKKDMGYDEIARILLRK